MYPFGVLVVKVNNKIYTNHIVYIYIYFFLHASIIKISNTIISDYRIHNLIFFQIQNNNLFSSILTIHFPPDKQSLISLSLPLSLTHTTHTLHVVFHPENLYQLSLSIISIYLPHFSLVCLHLRFSFSVKASINTFPVKKATNTAYSSDNDTLLHLIGILSRGHDQCDQR